MTEEEISNTVDAIVDWCASGQGRCTGATYFKAQIEEITSVLEKEDKDAVWEELLSYIESSEGWTVDDMHTLGTLLEQSSFSLDIVDDEEENDEEEGLHNSSRV